jgi:hypothetical protein
LKIVRAIALFSMVFLSACGTYVPDLINFPSSPDAEKISVSTLVDYVICDVKRSIQQVLLDNDTNDPPADLTWLQKWAAQVTFTLTVEEKSEINPGISLSKLYPNALTDLSTGEITTPQGFSMGLAAEFSADATRKETLQYFVGLKNIASARALAAARTTEIEGKLPSCRPAGAFNAEIKFMNWLKDALLNTHVSGGVIDYNKTLQKTGDILGVQSENVLSHEITFVVVYGGNANPSWTLVNFGGNTSGSPLLSATRTNTQDVLITLGEVGANQAFSSAAQATTLAAQIGLSVAAAVKSTTR